MIIGIAGGTGAGKSTFTNRLKAEFGDKIAIVYLDNYYRSGEGLPLEERAKINYDHPDALEIDLLVRHLEMLKNGEGVDCPLYDYTRHDRARGTVRVEPREVIVVEGILVLQNPRLRGLLDIKIYVEADADERVIRRALRDIRERGRSLESIFAQYLATVKPMHSLYVEPTKAMADIVINGGIDDVAFDLIKTKIASQLAKAEMR